MGRVLKGEVPLFVACNSAAEVVHFVDCAESALAGGQARVVVVAEGDAWMAADVLGARKWTVVARPAIAYEPNTRNRILPARVFADAGAKVALVPPADTVDGLEAALAAAAELVRAGLGRETALRALTATAAEAIGLGERVGSIEAGREANLLVFDQDPLSPLARVRRVLIQGETVWEQP
jgi:imidazolonepropionase-like amidohydrolase